MSNYIKNRRNIQKIGVFVGAKGAVAPQNVPYLTRINKSTSTSVKNDVFLTDFQSDNALKTFEASRNLADEINVRTVLDSDGLRHECLRGFIKMHVINENEFSIYKTPNPRGNPLCSIGLNKLNGEVLVSNSDGARFRARNRLIEIIKANTDFNYFFTGTFNPKKWNRKNFVLLQSSLTRWLRRRGIKYILIPEPHKDGSIHFHGFFNATIEPFLAEFDLSKCLPTRITDGIKDGREIFNCPDYAKMFGWVSIERIRNLEACAVYAAKYVSKNFEDGEKRFSYHRYFCSLGLKRPFNDIPTDENTRGFMPVRFSSRIEKVVYKRQSRDFSPLKSHGSAKEPEAAPQRLPVAKNSVFTGRAQARIIGRRDG